MALHRVRSREHGFESITSDEFLERWPDVFDVIDDEPIDRVNASSRRPDTAALPTIAPNDPDSDYR